MSNIPMNRLVSIREAAYALGVTPQTLRRWEAEGKMTVARTAGGQRRYDLSQLRPDLHQGETKCEPPETAPEKWSAG